MRHTSIMKWNCSDTGADGAAKKGCGEKDAESQLREEYFEPSRLNRAIEHSRVGD